MKVIELKNLNLKKYFKKIIITTSIIVTLLTAILISFYFISLNYKNIYYGLYIGETNLGGISKNEAEKIFSNYIDKEYKDKTITLNANGNKTKIKIESLISDYKIKENSKNIYDYKKNDSFINKALNIILKDNSKSEFKFNFKYDEKEINTILKDISNDINKEQELPKTKIKDGDLYLSKGNPEIILNINKSLDLIEDKLSKLENKEIELFINENYSDDFKFDKVLELVNKNAKDADIKISDNFNYEIIEDEVGYKVTKKELKRALEKLSDKNIKYVKLDAEFIESKLNNNTYRYNLFKDNLYTFTTEFNSEDYERTKNLSVAAEKINGKILKSGEEFSFDEVVGDISPENGFQFAKVYQDGMIALGVGGGICQIASTLHNTVLRIPELEVIERSNHSFTVSYVDEGFDAAISNESNKNYVFKNNFKYPIKILASLDDYTLRMTIKGTKESNKEVELWSETVHIIHYETIYRDASELSEGVEFVKSEPKNGAVVDTYIKIIENGEVIENKKIYTSEYIPLNNYEFY
jgi:vancomycin resistance protein YoaR